MKAKAAN